MNIKRKDQKSIVIHTKERPRLHVKTNSARIQKKEENTHAVKNSSQIKVDRSQRISRTKIKIRGGASGSYSTGNMAGLSGKDVRNGEKERKNGNEMKSANTAHRQLASQNKKNNTYVKAAVTVGTKSALDQMEGGREIQDSIMAAESILTPLQGSIAAGRQIYSGQMGKAKEKQMKKMQPGYNIRRKATKDSSVKAAIETSKAAAKKVTKDTVKAAAKTAAATAATAAGTAATGPGGILIGVAAGEAAGIAIDKKAIRNSTRNRMIQFLVSKTGQKENQDTIGKTFKDLAVMRLTMAAKYLVRYALLFLLGLFVLLAILALPVIAVVVIIYNSPFAVFFPSISSTETIQDVLLAYAAEFDAAVEDELRNYVGYDGSEKIYIEYEGAGTPDNYCDILAVYMVRYGYGDTATDMKEQAKENLKAVFRDMCSYTISSKTETGEDAEGNSTTTTTKQVNVLLKSYHDMISIYHFSSEEQEMLAEFMKPEYLAMLGFLVTDSDGQPGSGISPGQYQAIVDAISDANGKKVVEFVLSKVGYPYSQALRDSGDHFDCSSLAYYAWQCAGVSILYEGSNTAASEGKYCYDNNLLVSYDAMQPGDLIFYSYSSNGRFMNITHVAVYVGGGMVVEAANERIGVVYRPVQGRSSIVLIGRPR